MTQIEQIKAEIERLKAETFNKINHDKNRSMVTDVANSQRITICEQLLHFINSLPNEKPSEDLEEAAKEYVKENCILPEDCNNGDIPYYEECTVTVFKDGANWQKEQLINKACEWLKENIYNRVYKCNDSLGFPTATFLEEFRKAMEE